MDRIINIPYDGEARISLKEYNDMRDRIKELEEQNTNLTDMLDHVCDDNKVRQRRQIILTNPRGRTQQEIIEDRLINMEDITQELDQRIRDCEDDWKRKYDELESDNRSITKTLDECQRQKINYEQEAYRLKHRTLWQRLWNI